MLYNVYLINACNNKYNMVFLMYVQLLSIFELYYYLRESVTHEKGGEGH